MADNYLAYITLPADISKVTIEEIPELFANAIHSGVSENEPRQVTEVKKFPLTEAAKHELCNAPFSFPVSLTDNDLMELSKGVWKHLEPLKLPTLEEAWKPYFDAFMANPREDWRLDVLIINPYLNQQILWHHTVKEYQKNVKIAANGKLLKPFDPSTFLPSPNASGEWLNSCYVTLENLREYAASLNIGVNLLEQSSGEDLLGLTIKDGLFHIRNANGSSTLSSTAYEIEKIAFNQRLAKGNYTLNDAAMTIEESVNASAHDMVNKLVQAAEKGSLKMFDPISDARWLYGEKFNSTIRCFYEVTTYSELNSWLKENEPLITWRFPEPKSLSIINSTLLIENKLKANEPDGKLPRIAIARLAIKAAYELEVSSGKRASANEVITLLQEWAKIGKHSDTLNRSEFPKRGVYWLTSNAVNKTYSVEACQKALEKWNKSRT